MHHVLWASVLLKNKKNIIIQGKNLPTFSRKESDYLKYHFSTNLKESLSQVRLNIYRLLDSFQKEQYLPAKYIYIFFK